MKPTNINRLLKAKRERENPSAKQVSASKGGKVTRMQSWREKPPR